MAENSFDVIIIGGGPGGYVCAIRAAQLGLKAACVEFRGALGGTCLNVGCIPSKALLHSSEVFTTIKHAEKYGIKVQNAEADIPAMVKRKDEIVKGLTGGIAGLFKKNKVTYLQGYGSFVSSNEVAVKNKDGKSQTYQAKHIVIATGSEPIEIPSAKFDQKTIVSSTEALDFEKAPKHLVVIGGGVIGLELGSVWCRLGSKVTVIEAMPEILYNLDKTIRDQARRILAKQGLEFLTNTKVKEVTVSRGSASVIADGEKGAIELKADKVLVAVGRRPFTKDLGLENAGLTTNNRGQLEVDNHWRSKVKNIWALGDVIHGPMLAHKAEEEGVAVAESIAGKPGHVNYEAIPNVIYTWPEIASVGASEQELKDKGIKYKVGKFPFLANGRAKCNSDTDGLVKIIADEKTDRLLGFHIIGPHASELIAEAAIAFEFGASAEDIARSVHAHPTLAEAMKEAALDVDKRALHF